MIHERESPDFSQKSGLRTPDISHIVQDSMAVKCILPTLAPCPVQLNEAERKELQQLVIQQPDCHTAKFGARLNRLALS